MKLKLMNGKHLANETFEFKVNQFPDSFGFRYSTNQWKRAERKRRKKRTKHFNSYSSLCSFPHSLLEMNKLYHQYAIKIAHSVFALCTSVRISFDFSLISKRWQQKENTNNSNLTDAGKNLWIVVC